MKKNAKTQAQAAVKAAHPYAAYATVSVRTLEEITGTEDLRVNDGWDPDYGDTDDYCDEEYAVDILLGTVERTYRYTGASARDFAAFVQEVRSSAFSDDPQGALMSTLVKYRGIRLANMLEAAIIAANKDETQYLLGKILAA